MRSRKAACTSSRFSATFSLTWQLRHQAAEKSTKTGTPAARAAAWRSGDHGCQPRQDAGRRPSASGLHDGGSMDTGPLVAALADTGAACVWAASATTGSRLTSTPQATSDSSAVMIQAGVLRALRGRSSNCQRP